MVFKLSKNFSDKIRSEKKVIWKFNIFSDEKNTIKDWNTTNNTILGFLISLTSPRKKHIFLIETILSSNILSFLDIHISSVEKLQQQNIYPIVILIKFKSVKHIKEINIWDSRGGTGQQDKPTMKDAKNMQELSIKLEQDYKHLISDTVLAGANIMLICAQVYQ